MTNPAYKIAISEGSRTKIVYLYTQSGYWTVPTDWNNNNNKIEAIGGGGGGASVAGGGGGGGGAYSALANIVLAPGTQYPIVIGSGGAPGNSGQNTTFNTTQLVATGGAAGSTLPSTALGGQASACTPNTAGVAQNGGNGGSGAQDGVNNTYYMGGGGGGAAGPGYAGRNGGDGNLSIGAGGGGGSGGISSTKGNSATSSLASRFGGSGGVGPSGIGSGNGTISNGGIGLYGGGGAGGGYGSIAMTYSAGNGGLMGAVGSNGQDGGNTSVTVFGITITGTGGQGSVITTNVNTAPGFGTSTVAGSIFSSLGGYGSNRTGTYAGGGGGGIGGGNALPGTLVGGTGGQSIDFYGLQGAVTSLGYSWTGPGVGAGSSPGGDATGFGCGGAGGSGSVSTGAYGGKGLWGGGGGGYSGATTLAGIPPLSGGNGIVILQYITVNGSVTNVALTNASVYYMPNNTASFKIWAIGGGGGSGRGTNLAYGTPGGGSGGIAYMSVSGGYNGGSGGQGGNGTVSSNGWATNLLQYAGPGGGGGGAAPGGIVTTISGSAGTAGNGGYYGGGGGGGVTAGSGAPGLLAISYTPLVASNVIDVDDLLVQRSNFVPGNLWGFGAANSGSLANYPNNQSSPVTLGSATDWNKVVASGSPPSSAAISTSGNLYVWGDNTNGQLGLGDAGPTTSRSVITQLGTNTWKQICFGGITNKFALAIRNDGTMWGWGYNTPYYTLGNGTTISTSSPVQIGRGLSTWKQVAAGDLWGVAIANDGTLWGWGGTSSTPVIWPAPGASTPVQLGTLTSWKSVITNNKSVYALTTDGTLWAWGDNTYGQLGTGDTLYRSSPVQIGSQGFWQSVATSLNGGGAPHFVAVSASGKLFTWGNNFSYGELGQNDLVSRSSPTQVGTLTDWKTAIAGDYSSGCIKTDNSLWTWGYNLTGNLGLGDTISRSSPTQVGTSTTWKSVSMGYTHSLAIMYSG